MSNFLAITNAQILGGGTSLLIEGDRIAGIDLPIPADASTLDAKGAIVAPGLVDLGVFSVDKRACIAGGITRVALMPDQTPVLDEPGIVQRAALAAKPDLWVHPLAAATKGLEGRELGEVAMMRKAGARAIATGRHWIADSGVMMKVMAYAASLNMTLISHAEDGGLAGNAVATSGEIASRLGLASAPAEAEAIAIARDLMLAELTGVRLHFRKVTTARGLDMVRAAKAKGLPVSCGISPTHLFLSEVAIHDFRTFARLNPPLRSEADRQACLAAITDGTIDVLCSAHDPRGPEAKRLPFADADPGAAGAETLLALALGLVRDGRIDMARLFDLLAANPSRLLGLDSGQIAPGAPADLVVFDAETPWQIDAAKFVGQAGNTPFDKLPVQGRVKALLKGGRLLG
jgi:dihydroorotase